MKPWNPRLYVVEIWWKHEIDEWLFDAAFITRKDAAEYVKKMRKSGYRFRIVRYARETTR